MAFQVSLIALFLAVAAASPAYLPLPDALAAQDYLEGVLAAPEEQRQASCGVSKISYEGDRIVGGRDAVRGEYPWQVSLQRRNYMGKYSHICGGTLYEDKYVLTAAHCVDGGTASNYQAMIGGHSLKSPNSSQKTVKVSKIMMHPNYNSNTIDNDIAILFLDTSVDKVSSNGYINSACLPTANSEPKGMVTATGWGAVKEGGASPAVLQAVEIPIVSRANCQKAYGASMITDSMICAGVAAGGKDSCQGDSGGPLVQNGELVGIVSWGYGCARPNYPGVYTSASHHLSWIQTNCK